MKYICLGYMQEDKWHETTEADRNAMIDECFAYDEWLMANGHFAGGSALQSTASAMTLRYQDGQVAVLDGPFAETKEQLGGILILEANDLNHAIQLMRNHPGVRLGGCFEIRPAADLNEMMAASAERRKVSA